MVSWTIGVIAGGDHRLGTYNLKFYVRLEGVKLGVCFISLMLSVSTPAETLALHAAAQSAQIQLKDRAMRQARSGYIAALDSKTRTKW